MLNRDIAGEIHHWVKHGEKPLIITGARQVGKTYIVRESLKGTCKLHTFNFEKTQSLRKLFDGDLKPKDLIRALSVEINEPIDLGKDIIFFDEIQSCERALTSLKYFHEDLPEAKLIASGSYLGLMQGFPVGKVTSLEMFPMTFSEFLRAAVGEGPIFNAFQVLDLSVPVFAKIWPLLLEYFYVGGLPEAVSLWMSNRRHKPVQAAEEVREFHKEILKNYSLDFGKYSQRNAPHIIGVFQNIAHQLAGYVDDSVKKFKFKDVLPNKKSYSQLQGPIEWLEQMRMLHRAFIVNNPQLPLIATESIFRVYMFDMGILSSQLDLSLAQHMAADFAYKGYIAENFVALELKASGAGRLFGWESKGDAEIEFIAQATGKVAIPIEVKSGKRTQAKSLETYRTQYAPDRSIKLIGAAGSTYDRGVSLPLYYAGSVRALAQGKNG